MSEQELKSCPFCGSACKLGGSVCGAAWVVCSGCYAESNATNSAEMAIQHWNTRAQSQPVSAQPAGEVPEVVAWIAPSGFMHKDKRTAETNPVTEHTCKVEPLMTIAQHTRIVAALQARAVVMPERVDSWVMHGDEHHYAKGWNAYADEYARLNGKGGV